jgi:hypothetical protein
VCICDIPVCECMCFHYCIIPSQGKKLVTMVKQQQANFKHFIEKKKAPILNKIRLKSYLCILEFYAFFSSVVKLLHWITLFIGRYAIQIYHYFFVYSILKCFITLPWLSQENNAFLLLC